MKMAKRLMSLLMVVVMLFTVTNAGTAALASFLWEKIDVAAYFTVPELIYLKPGYADFQYYINGVLNGEEISPDAASTGSIKFDCEQTVSSVTVSCSGAKSITLSQTTGTNVRSFTSTITGGSMESVSSGTLTWKVTYVVNGRTYATYAYTYVYSPFLGQVGTQLGYNWDAVGNDPTLNTYMFTTGIHSVTGGNARSAFTLTSGLFMSPLVAGWTHSNVPEGNDKGYINSDGETYDYALVYFPEQQDGGVSRGGRVRGEARDPSMGATNTPVGIINIDISRYPQSTALSKIPNFKSGMMLFCSDDSSVTHRLASFGSIAGDLILSTPFDYENPATSRAYGLFSPSGNVPVNDTTYSILAKLEFERSSSKKITMSLFYALQVKLVDKAALRTAVSNAIGAGYNENDYESEVWAAYLSALKSASESLGNPDQTQEQVDSALANLVSVQQSMAKKQLTYTITHKLPAADGFEYTVGSQKYVAENGYVTIIESGNFIYGSDVSFAPNNYSGYVCNDTAESYEMLTTPVSRTYVYEALTSEVSLMVPSIHYGYYNLDTQKLTATYGQKLILPELFVFGWKFNGWYAESSYQNLVQSGKYVDYYSSDKTFYASLTCFFAGGHGSESDPFLVSSVTQLNNIDDTTVISHNRGVYFKQTADLQYTSNFTPVSTFAGYYDGQGYGIDIPASAVLSGASDAGVFGKVTDGWIKNLKVNVEGKFDSSGTGSTGFVGNLENSSLSNIQVIFSGTVGSANGNAGVLVGTATGTSSITDSAVTFNGGYVKSGNGAFIGYKEDGVTVTNTWTFLKTEPTRFSTAGSNNVMRIVSAGAEVELTYIQGRYYFNANSEMGWTTVFRDTESKEVVANSSTYSPLASLDGADYEICFIKAISFSAGNGGTVTPSGSVNLHRDEKVQLTVSAKTGYYFTGYDNTTDGSITATDDGYVFTMKEKSGEVVFNFAPVKYTVRFDANSGADSVAVPAVMTVSYDETFAIPSMVPERFGYAFVSWNTKPDGTGSSYLPSQSGLVNLSSVDGDAVTLYGVWLADSYVVTFDPDGGSFVSSITDIKAGQMCTFPSSQKTGYVLSYWQDVNSATTVPAGGELQINSNRTFKAVWSPIKYTVSFDANGGTNSPDSVTATYGLGFTIPEETPEKPGYNFVEWNSARAGSGISYESGQTASDNLSSVSGAVVTLYAQWEPKTFTVTWDLNEGNIDGDTSSKTTLVVYGQNYSVISDVPKRDNFVFAGWFTEKTGGTQVTSSTVFNSTEDVTVYAQWNYDAYIVKFNAGASDAVGSMADFTAVYGSSATLPLNTYTRPGYSFAGWATEIGGEAVYDDGNTALDYGNITLYAVWTAKSYTVTYNLNGGSGSLMLQSGFKMGTDKEIRSYTGTRSGYVFAGWARTLETANSYNVEYSNAETVTVDSEFINYASGTTVTLYAVWYPLINVTWNLNGGKYNGAAVDPVTQGTYFGQNYSVPTGILSRAGYVFDSWYTDALGGTEITNDDVINSFADVTLYAHWNRSSNVNYTVNHYQQNVDGTYPTKATQSVVLSAGIDDEITLSALEFEGFSVDEALSDKDVVINDENLVFSIYYAREQYDVVFRSGEAQQNEYTQSFLYGETKDLEKNRFSLTGYAFAGWATSENGSASYLDGASYTMSSKGTVLYAVWKIRQFTISFNSNGGSYVGSITADYGSKISAPADPIFIGNTFKGWYIDNENELYTFTTMPAQDITLNALWSGERYTLSYDGNGYTDGTLPEESKVYYSATVVLPGADIEMYKDGEYRKFYCWTDGKTYYAAGSPYMMPAEPVELTAVWSADYYQLKTLLDEVDGYYENGKLPAGSKDPLYAAGGSIAESLSSDGYYDWNCFYTENLETEYSGALSTLSAVYSKEQQIYIDLAYQKLKGAVDSLELKGVDFDEAVGCTAAGDSYVSDYTGESYPSCDGEHSFNGVVALCDEIIALTDDECIYTKESVDRLYNALYGSNGLYDYITSKSYKIPSQSTVNEATESVAYYYHTLELKSADYSEVDNVINEYLPAVYPGASYANLSTYFTADSAEELRFVYGEINRELKIVEQDYADEYVQQLKDAVDNLVPLSADYTQLFIAIAGIPCGTAGFEYPSSADKVGASNYSAWYEWASTASLYDELDIEWLSPRYTESSLYAVKILLESVAWDSDVFGQEAISACAAELTKAVSELEFIEYTATYMLGDKNGTVYKSFSGKYLEEITVPENPARDGYIFAKWVDENGLEVIPGGNYIENVVYYATWTDNVSIKAADGSATVIDRDNMIIKGLDEKISLDNVSDYIVAVGDGELEFTDCITYLGTGTKVSLTDSKTGTVIEEYIIVLYGDVNGDGVFSSADQTLIKKAAAGSIELEGVFAKAADVDANGTVDSTDYALIKSALKGLTEIEQA